MERENYEITPDSGVCDFGPDPVAGPGLITKHAYNFVDMIVFLTLYLVDLYKMCMTYSNYACQGGEMIIKHPYIYLSLHTHKTENA